MGVTFNKKEGEGGGTEESIDNGRSRRELGMSTPDVSLGDVGGGVPLNMISGTVRGLMDCILRPQLLAHEMVGLGYHHYCDGEDLCGFQPMPGKPLVYHCQQVLDIWASSCTSSS